MPGLQDYIGACAQEARRGLHHYGVHKAKLLSDFDFVNAHLVEKALRKQENLLIELPETTDRARLLGPVLLTLALQGFFQNYVECRPEPDVGDVVFVRKSAFVRGELFKYARSGRGPELRRQRKHESTVRLSTTLPLQSFDPARYVVANKDLSKRIPQDCFDLYARLFDFFLETGGEVLSRLKHKYLVVAGKGATEDALKNLRVDEHVVEETPFEALAGQGLHKAIPYRYVAETGTSTDSLPLDPMIYVVKHYDVAREHVFPKIEGEFDATVVVGAHRYRDETTPLAMDQRRGKMRSCVFIGSEHVPQAFADRAWRWSPPELHAFEQPVPPSLEVERVQQPGLREATQAFKEEISEIEAEAHIYLENYVRYYLPRVWTLNVSNRLGSPLDAERDQLHERFQTDDTLETTLTEAGIHTPESCARYQHALNEAFDELLESVTTENRKFEKLAALLKDADWLVAPRRLAEPWRTELDALDASEIEVVTPSALRPQDSANDGEARRVVQLGFYGEAQLERLFRTSHNHVLLLYEAEHDAFRDEWKRYREALAQGFQSQDRAWFFDAQYEKQASSLVDRLREGTYDWSGLSRDYADRDRTAEMYAVAFADGTREELPATKNVLKKEADGYEEAAVFELRPGDGVRVYANVHRDALYESMRAHDRSGLFDEIDHCSALWKRALQTCRNGASENAEALLREMRDQGLSITSKHTLEQWLNPESDVAFPSRKEDLRVIAEFSEDGAALAENLGRVQEAKRKHRGITTALGQDLSEETFAYVKSDGAKKGPLLDKFTDRQVAAIVRENMPERTVRTIERTDAE
jgi:hypothetical protein